MSRREELKALIEDSEAKIREASLELSKMKAQDKEEANAQLAAIVKTIESLYYDAKNLANEFCLEFSIDADDFSHEFEAWEYGNWNHSTC